MVKQSINTINETVMNSHESWNKMFLLSNAAKS